MLLWRHASGTLLAGSAHVLRKEDRIPEWLDRAFHDKAALVLECRFDEADQELKKLPHGRTLKEFVRARTLRGVLRAAEALQINEEDVLCLKPYACAFRLAKEALALGGFDFEYGVDACLFRRAIDEEKPIWGLEDPRTLDALLGSMDLDVQDEYLFKTTSELDRAVSKATALIDDWYEADLAAFEVWQREMPNEVYKRLVVQRNQWWVESILNGVCEAPNALLLVGSIHLTGSDSLIEMLARRGLLFEKVQV